MSGQYGGRPPVPLGPFPQQERERAARIKRLQHDRAVMWKALCRIAEGASATGGDPSTVARDAINEVST